MDGIDIAAEILERGRRIEREKNGQALTPEEASAVQAAEFLRKIAPYMFDPKQTGDAEPQ
jgi:hypothetical protein